MKVGYTEFSFAYAFTENLIRSRAFAPTGAPVFPNLVQEAQLGFDVRIDLPAAPVFFQYKLPELMTRNSAFEIVGGQCPHLTTDFFRIALMRRDLSDQHKHLIEWEGRYPGLVFYATPCLPTCAAFNHAYVSCGVAQNAMLFSPAEIGPLPDDKVHTIAYRPGLSVGYFCSEPKPVSAQNIDGLAGRIAESFREKRFQDLRRTASEVRDAVLEAAAPASRNAAGEMAARVRQRIRLPTEDGATRASEDAEIVVGVLVAREIARVDLGIDLVIAQPKDSP